MPRPAVFLDRDDTLIDTHVATRHYARPGDLGDPALVHLLPGVHDALRRLQAAGFALVVYSSQGGVARGPYGLREVEAVNQALRDRLAEPRPAVRLDALYYCPFHPEGTVAPFNTEHPWRKPAPAMILAAAAELALDLTRSFAIGDKARDVQCAVNAGIARQRCFLLGTSGEENPDVPDLPAAAARILADVASAPRAAEVAR